VCVRRTDGSRNIRLSPFDHTSSEIAMGIRLLSFVFLGLLGACAANPSPPSAPEPLAAAPFVPSETDRWGELQIDGRVENISVTPSHEVWITTMMGNSYLAPGINAD